MFALIKFAFDAVRLFKCISARGIFGDIAVIYIVFFYNTAAEISHIQKISPAQYTLFSIGIRGIVLRQQRTNVIIIHPKQSLLPANNTRFVNYLTNRSNANNAYI